MIPFEGYIRTDTQPSSESSCPNRPSIFPPRTTLFPSVLLPSIGSPQALERQARWRAGRPGQQQLGHRRERGGNAHGHRLPTLTRTETCSSNGSPGRRAGALPGPAALAIVTVMETLGEDLLLLAVRP